MTFTKYLIGDPASGPFADFTATDDAAARRYVADNYGPVLDTVDWTDEDGQPVPLLIVAADNPLYDLPDPGDDPDVEPDPGFWDRLDAAWSDRRAAIEADADDAELRGAYATRDRILAGLTPCIGCGAPAGPDAVSGQIGQKSGPLCPDCAWHSDGNIIPAAQSG